MVILDVRSVHSDKYNGMYLPLQCHKQSSFASLKILCALWIHPSLPLNSRQPLIFFPVSIVLPCPECPVVGIRQYINFSDLPLSLSNMHLQSLLHVFL